MAKEKERCDREGLHEGLVCLVLLYVSFITRKDKSIGIEKLTLRF